MIAKLKGIIETKSPNRVVVDVNGVGYEVHIPLSTFYNLPREDEMVEFEIYTHVREDSIILFGFSSFEEKRLFEHLIGVTKIGPKLALNILSGIEPFELWGAICSSDILALSGIPGVGKKTAERLVYELRDKIIDMSLVGNDKGSNKVHSINKTLDDVISALINLGYSKGEAESVVKKIYKSHGKEGSVEEILKESLKSLGK